MGHQLRNKWWQLFGIGSAHLLVFADHDLLEEFIGSVGSEGRPQHGHLIENATQRPDIAFVVIGLFVPDFRRGVIGSTGLGDGELVDEMFGDVEVSDFCDFIMKEDVGWFDISVDNISLVEFIQSFQYIIRDFPYLIFWNSLLHSQCFFYAVLD